LLAMGYVQQRSRKKIAYVLTSPLSLRLIRGQLQHLEACGFDTEVICGDDIHFDAGMLGQVPINRIPLRREISPIADLVSLIRMIRILRHSRPDIVNVSTPKAAFLGSVASALTAIPGRVYVMRGLRFETAKGVKRFVLKATEKLTCSCVHRVICVSSSLLNKAIAENLVKPAQASVLASGSSNGVDASRFGRTDGSILRANQLRRQLQIPMRAPVLGFVGRFTRDKGIPELVEAFQCLRSEWPDLRLLMIGDFEVGDALSSDLRRVIESDSSIVRTGFVTDPISYYSLIDLLVLPTHREGFPNVCLEAQAAGLPVITTSATGAIDSVIHGKTGIIVPVGNASALQRAIEQLLGSREIRQKMGRDGQNWVSDNFKQESVWSALETEYRSLLESSPHKQTGWRRLVKVIGDRAIAAVGLVVFSPLLLAISIGIRLSLGTPVLFRQLRPGLHGRAFSLVKFRTMSNMTGSDGKLLGDEKRMTTLGRLLRSLSMDELPQLWNVLRGDLSLVGPRPLLMDYLDRYTSEQARRHDVLPGITGWAQVNGRNAITWEEKFSFDLWYVNNWSLQLDIKILLLTIWHVLRGKGTSQPGYATAQEFLGVKKENSA
jgi:lipopolysaccharide/colanic/teichoic acid biosynthesis glycosyltransferase